MVSPAGPHNLLVLKSNGKLIQILFELFFQYLNSDNLKVCVMLTDRSWPAYGGGQDLLCYG